MTEAGEFAMWLAIGGVLIVTLVGPIGQAIGRRIAGRRTDASAGLTTGQMAAERMAELEARMAEVDQAQARLGGLEERLEFAERLLAQASLEQRALGRTEGP